jgi:hypothetical protein
MSVGGARGEQAVDSPKHDSDPVAQQAPIGVGTAHLRMLMFGGVPTPDMVVKLLAEYPREHHSIINACMTTFGNSYVQQVIKASAVATPGKAPAVVAPQLQDPHTADEAVKQKVRESVAELNATTYAALLVAAKGDTDAKQGRWRFLNILDGCDDTLTRHKMMDKFQAMTNEPLEHFIKNADWHGKRDQQRTPTTATRRIAESTPTTA